MILPSDLARVRQERDARENVELQVLLGELHRILRAAGYTTISTDPAPGCQPRPRHTVTPCDVERLLNMKLEKRDSSFRVRVAIDPADPGKVLVTKILPHISVGYVVAPEGETDGN